MSAPIPLRRDFGAFQLRGLAKKTKDGPQARRLLALAAIYDGASAGRKKPTGLRAVFRLLRQTTQLERTKISAQWYRSRHDEPPAFAMLNQTRAHPGVRRVKISGTRYNRT